MKLDKIKEILRPTRNKIILSVGLFIVSSVVFSFFIDLIYSFHTGWFAPFPIYVEETVCPMIDVLREESVNASTSIENDCPSPTYYPAMTLLNTALWYTTSSVVIHFRGEKE